MPARTRCRSYGAFNQPDNEIPRLRGEAPEPRRPRLWVAPTCALRSGSAGAGGDQHAEAVQDAVDAEVEGVVARAERARLGEGGDRAGVAAGLGGERLGDLTAERGLQA